MVSNAKDYVKCISKPSFVISNNFAIHEVKPVFTLNKPIYVGFSILHLSKLLICDFHYKYIKSKLDAKLLFTVTGSLVYKIKTEDVYEDFYQDKNLFDFSDYLLNSKFFNPANKKVIDKIKDLKREEFKGREVQNEEFKGIIISEFVKLKSKMYSLIDVDDEEFTKAKGVNRRMRDKEFCDVFFNKKVIRHNVKRI